MEHFSTFAPHFEKKLSEMGITRLKRKAKRNKQTAAKRQHSIKQLSSKPVIKNIDKEAIKASFGTPSVKKA